MAHNYRIPFFKGHGCFSASNTYYNAISPFFRTNHTLSKDNITCISIEKINRASTGGDLNDN